MATLLTTKTRARERADMVDSNFISDSELTSYINASYYELYDLLVQTYEDYFITSSTFTLTSSDSGVFALPATFYKLKGLDYQLGGDFITIYPYDWNTRNVRQRSANRLAIGDVDLAYRMIGSNLRIEPRNNATGDYQLWYIPSLTALSDDADILDTQLTRNGWDEFIVVDAAIKMLAKEESDTRHLNFEKQELIKRIVSAAAERDVDQPEMVSDVTSYQSNWDLI